MHQNGVWKGFMGSRSDDLQTSPSPDSPHQYINILVSLCALTVKILWAVCKLCCFLLLALVCYTLPGFYYHVIEHLAARRSEAYEVSYLFV